MRRMWLLVGLVGRLVAARAAVGAVRASAAMRVAVRIPDYDAGIR